MLPPSILKIASYLDDGAFVALMIVLLAGYRFLVQQARLPVQTRKWILSGLLLLFLSSILDFADEFIFLKTHQTNLAEAVHDFFEDSIGRTLGMACLAWGIFLTLRQKK